MNLPNPHPEPSRSIASGPTGALRSLPGMRGARAGRVLAALLLPFLAACAASTGGGAYPGIDPAARAPAAGGAPGALPGGGTPGDRTPGVPPSGIRIHTGSGEPAGWDALVDAARGARVVLLGELHDDVVGHQVRHALVEALAGGAAVGAEGDCAPQVLSLEMLEVDVQLVVDEYQAGLITPEHFRRAARPWENHARDYEPYLEVARGCGFPVVAANPPRRYVNRVARLGTGALEALAPEALATLPPLPVAPPSERYRAQWSALMGGAGHGAPPAHGGGGDPVLEAQNLWDAGMAWAVAEAALAHPQARVIHVAGAFHVQDRTGIAEHLERYLPGVAPLVIVAYPVAHGASFDPEAHGEKGDFVVLTPR
jgi:uncharacterized iron-regulated protein